MIANVGLLTGPAKEGGIKFPPTPEERGEGTHIDDYLLEFDANEYPHWAVYLNIQLGRPMPTPHAHWDNAQIIGTIPEERIREITLEDLENLGISI